MGQPFGTWFYRALVLLVISCPCALVISTPVSVVSAIAAAARNGVLIKGGVHLERSGAVRCVAFDKTGTLTKGSPHVVEVVPLNDTAIDEILEIAAGLEARSEHPIGRAILARAVESGIALAGIGRVPVDTGTRRGGNGGRAARARRQSSADRGARLCNAAIHSKLDSLAASGRTAVLVARPERPLGIIALADRPRESGRDAIEMLRRQGIERVVMLTGDNQASAEALARELGIDEIHAELLPHDKVEAVQKLRGNYGTVAMVGDGVNDAPALAAADVGIAMGAAGTDAALETADIALMADELLKIPFAIRLGRATLRNIQMNVTLSLGLKAVFLVPRRRRIGHIVDGGDGRHGRVAAGDRERMRLLRANDLNGRSTGHGVALPSSSPSAMSCSDNPHARDTQAVDRFHAQRPRSGLHHVANLRAPSQPPEHVAAERRVGFFVDIESELLVDVGDQRETVDFRRSIRKLTDRRRAPAPKSPPSSPTIRSMTRSNVTSPAVPPYSSMTMA